MADPGRTQLGEFLRSRRHRLTPKAVGLSATRRRRTPGLRREEVAQLAGIGVDWYIRLEQGRAVSPSVTTIDALARALRLGRVEHAHLRALAQDTGRLAFTRETVPGALARMVEGLNQPAYITGRRWDVLVWNAAAEELFPKLTHAAESDRNILVYMLTDPDARLLFGAGWTEEARRMVAQFRTTHDLWAGDPAFVALLERLRAGSGEFSAWWDTHDVRSTASGEKLLYQQDRSTRRFAYATFQANDDPSLKLAIYTPV